MFSTLRRVTALLAIAAAGAFSGTVLAQAYPARTVSVVTPYATGGSVDAVARMLAEEFRASLGQTFIVENRVGAFGNIAAEYVAKAKPDGYVLLVHNASAVASSISAFKQLGFDPRKDFAPVAIVASQPGILVTHPSVPVRSVQDFIAFAKARPGKLNYGVGGVFGPTHTPAVLFAMKTGIDIVPVMYKGAAPAITDLVGGQIDLMFDTVPTSLPFVRAGKLRALAVTSAHRLSGMPDVPTVQESGIAGYEFNSWIGMSAPAGTPREIITRLNAEIGKLLSKESFLKRLADYGLEPSKPASPEEFRAFISTEIDLYANIVKASGIAPQ